ncbi:hypothetical protein AV530_017480 [Patagioenas fasciata monilis]|uniref:Uncharacterized protein n=1 Tax=Patagioenas fasciata monilis TaxID=372326 RepID=A0A1V4JHM3_PATFA|nr:hypothetical protein AV530_017480 [Patagioenas fasciata monilis]
MKDDKYTKPTHQKRFLDRLRPTNIPPHRKLEHLSLNKSSDCLIALVVELFRSLTAGSFADPSLHMISSGIKYTTVLSAFQTQQDQTGGRLILD